ncbi:hypothetical protein ACI3KY_19290, partial [Microbacterium sp. ZW T2_14]
MSLPTDPPLDELRALRERAYGRDADIQDDPQALARLRELEAQSAGTAAADGTTPSAATDGTPHDSAAAGRAGDPTAAARVGDDPGRLPYGGGVTDTASPRSGITPLGAPPGAGSAVDAGGVTLSGSAETGARARVAAPELRRAVTNL